MLTTTHTTYKTAHEEWEFAQIHHLNYQTFVEEIPQHPPNHQNTLIDRFHEQNTYIIALRKCKLVGMVAVRARRPFSLDEKIPNLDAYLPPTTAPCELRLLAVAPAQRRGLVLGGLFGLLATYCQQQSYDLAVISGTLRQQKLYQHLGFVPFGPCLGR